MKKNRFMRILSDLACSAIVYLVLFVIAFALIRVAYWQFKVNHPGAPWWGCFLHD